MSLNNVVSIPDYAMRLTHLANEIGRMHSPPMKDVSPTIWKHVTQARQITPGLNPQQILLFSVPQNTDFTLVYINVRLLDFADKIASDELWSPGSAGSKLTLFLKVNGAVRTLEQSYLALANKPVLFTFTSGDLIGLIQSGGSGTSDIVGSFDGFFSPADASIASRFAAIQTTVLNATTVSQGQTGGSGGQNTNGVITVGNTPF